MEKYEKIVMGIIVVLLVTLGIKVFSLGLESISLIAEIQSTRVSSDTYYIFPEGLTPIAYRYGMSFWLCEDENGEYLACEPTIEYRPKGDNSHDG